ncbi:unnamed protein product [Mytilus coruscus]|uniref:ZP domain-containing protein n=1 Tax=Mytilus coruscus TaxID=42192 RepID=A0A6J8APK4_MYTCO|nr:unnamed protein product [Mytilus coruscus]
MSSNVLIHVLFHFTVFLEIISESKHIDDQVTYDYLCLAACGKNGVELAQTIDFSHIAIATGTGQNRKYCKPKDKTLTPCTKPQNPNSLTVLYEEETKDSIIGGKTVAIYKLTCLYHPVNITSKSTVFTANKEPSTTNVQDHQLPQSFSLQLSNGIVNVSEATQLKIGDKLLLQMIGTDVAISPIICYAYPENDKKKNVTIWKLHTEHQGEANCVNEDSAIIETPKWKKIAAQRPSIQINMFAFRFITSVRVAIECMATVCAKDDHVHCPETCVDTSRRRRSFHIVGKNSSSHIRSSSVSFAVTDDKSLDNSSSGSFTFIYWFILFSILLDR